MEYIGLNIADNNLNNDSIPEYTPVNIKSPINTSEQFFKDELEIIDEIQVQNINLLEFITRLIFDIEENGELVLIYDEINVIAA